MIFSSLSLASHTLDLLQFSLNLKKGPRPWEFPLSPTTRESVASAPFTKKDHDLEVRSTRRTWPIYWERNQELVPISYVCSFLPLQPWAAASPGVEPTLSNGFRASWESPVDKVLQEPIQCHFCLSHTLCAVLWGTSRGQRLVFAVTKKVGILRS